MSLIQSQPRHPGGSSTGGQFTSRQNTPPEGTLAESASGSFAFPPRQFETVEEYIDFFETAPISDRVLSNADHAYRKWRQDQINAEVSAAYDVYGSDPEVVAAVRKNVIISDRKAREFVANSRAEAEAKRPMQSIDSHRLRNVLRAHQMWFYAATAPGEDARERILQHHLHDGEWTVQGIVDGNFTTQWASRALTDSDLAAVDAMERVAQTLSENAGY